MSTFKKTNWSWVQVGVLATLAGVVHAGDCVPHWDQSIGQPGLTGRAQHLFRGDMGDGEALYVGGDFTTAGGVAANGIVKWDGESFTAMGSGLGGSAPRPRAMTIWDDGSGPALYVAGDFTTAGGIEVNHIAKWDGVQWHALGTGIQTTAFAPARALLVYDDGQGEALYLGGTFDSASGVPGTKHVAKWDGKQWLPLGGTINLINGIGAMVHYDAGNGPVILMGTSWASIGGVTHRLITWNGQQWSGLATNSAYQGNPRGGIVVWDDGTGPAIYICGDGIGLAGAPELSMIVRWDGTTWSDLNGGLTGGLKCRTITVFNDGTGDALYVGGRFNSAGGIPANHVAKWDGNQWHALGGGTTHTVRGLAAFGDALYVGGGPFSQVDGQTAHNIAAWKGCPSAGVPGDLNGDGLVGVPDLLILLSAWGNCTNCANCNADLTGNCSVGVADLLLLLSHWG